jgi:putative spermidine/putrescine transport system substrate-binding protein
MKKDATDDPTACLGSQPSRRRVTVMLGQAAAAAALGLAMPTRSRAQTAKPLQGATVVFTSWGGAYQAAQKAAFCEPFAARTGATVVQDGPMDYSKYRTMLQSGAPTWDVVDVTIDFLMSAIKDDAFEKIDPAVVDLKRIDPRYVNEYGVGAIVWSFNLGYSATAYNDTTRPRSWADLFDLQKFPGRRMLRDRVEPMLEIALLADGVPNDKLYPLDVERAFRKLDTIKPQSVFWTTNSQSQQLLVDGEVSLGVIINGRLYDSVQKGAKLGMEWNQALQSVDYLVVSKGAKNRAVGMALIDQMTTAEAQARVANDMALAPTNPAAFALIKEEVKPWLSTNPANASRSLLIDEAYWRDNLKSLTERWIQWKLS